ncbi:hypothetical protein D3C78_1128320 [compost metagenome]
MLFTRLYNGIEMTSNGIMKMNMTSPNRSSLPLNLNLAKAKAAMELNITLKRTVVNAIKNVFSIIFP